VCYLESCSDFLGDADKPAMRPLACMHGQPVSSVLLLFWRNLLAGELTEVEPWVEQMEALVLKSNSKQLQKMELSVIKY